ncbi:IclR family transcriptional regulator [Sulfobacillus thermosulfidooxidans]|uniref:IclR family transcriptional regulator n=1 Tax=Sulfobacillus thermosulfidooxidans TaxID=28034 RepID=UPI0006B50883|nr:IclR family transcriptional regulator [Sulfobacillus thermosulfidooxidans]
MAESWTIKSLSRGLHLLDLLGEQPAGTTIKWLSRVSGIPISTCYHLINTLVDCGYVKKDRERHVYILSHKVSYLHSQIQSQQTVPIELQDLAHEMSRHWHETTYVAKWDGDEIVIQYIAEGNQALKVRSLYVGYYEHAFVHALGKAILAYVSPKTFHQYYLRHPPVIRTEHSRIQWNDLQHARLVTRERGYSLDEEEWEEGVCCIGVPIFNYTQSIWGSIAISLPRSRYDRLHASLLADLLQRSTKVSQELGFRVSSDQHPERVEYTKSTG